MTKIRGRAGRGIPLLLTSSAFLSKKIGLLLPIVVCLAATSGFAACHAVVPATTCSVNGNGTGWNCAASSGGAGAYNAIPATLVRGDIYYLADGPYPPYTFSTPASGTSTIEIRKAQSYDNCTSTGWNTSTMGASQAVFSKGNGTLQITAPYLVVNGNGTFTAQGCGGAPGTTVSASPPTPSDCGIKVDNSACTSGCYAPIGITTNNVTFEYVEVVGDSTTSANDDMEIYMPGSSTTTFTHIYGHNAGCVYFQDGLASWTLTYSYFWGTQVGGTLSDGCHGQFAFDAGSDSNSVSAESVFRDITGTAVWTFANSSTTHNNWIFYSNVIWDSSPAASWSPYLSDGVVACINAGTNCTNFVFVQNSIVGLPVTSTSGINNENTGSYTVENNLWYEDAFGVTFNVGTGGMYTQEYNSFLNSTSSCPSGTNNVCNDSASNPFTTSTGGVFTLASDGSNWNNRLSLGSPYTADAAGNTFTTDRGAYQYVSSGAPQPPTNLQAAAH